MSADEQRQKLASVASKTQQRGLGAMLGSVMDVGREVLAKRGLVTPAGATPYESLLGQCRELLHHRGEASGLALAGGILKQYELLTHDERLAFFRVLANEFEVDTAQAQKAAQAYCDNPGTEQLGAISRAVEAPRQKLFRRVNMAPGGTAALVVMRGHLRTLLRENPDLKPVDSDFKHLFISWFNKGFLELRRIDWTAPALELEKIIAYEAVHEINGWDDLHSRLRADRRCFAFFHPALEHDPLVFVEVALTDQLPTAIAPLLAQQREPVSAENATTVVFYSISNCHAGLAGVSFGNFLIKNVVQELKKEMPRLKTFVTLSPVPGFRRWLQSADLEGLVDESLHEMVREPVGRVVETAKSEALIKLCAHYLVNEKSGILAKDPVARFHLGNGASLHRMHASADMTLKGREQSGGIMVNYLYDLSKIEFNHEAYFDEGTIAVSRSVIRMLG